MAQPFPDNLYLTGFLGAGKSTVGKILAARLRWSYLDTDDKIEARAGMELARFFAQYGERPFRVLESRVVGEVARGREQVVALGGGALWSAETREHLLRTGLLLYLRASVQTLAARLQDSDGPLVRGYRGAALVKRVGDLLRAREAIYELAALHVDTEGKTPDEVAAFILGRLAT